MEAKCFLCLLPQISLPVKSWYEHVRGSLCNDIGMSPEFSTCLYIVEAALVCSEHTPLRLSNVVLSSCIMSSDNAVIQLFTEYYGTCEAR